MNQSTLLILAGCALIWSSGLTTKVIENSAEGPILRTIPVENSGLLRIAGFGLAGYGLFSLATSSSRAKGRSDRPEKKAESVAEVFTEDLPFVDGGDGVAVNEAIALDFLNRRSTSKKRDVLDDLAEYRGHLLLSCRTQSGKTSTMLGIADRKIDRFGYANFTVVDPKGTVWGGLENEMGGDNKPRVVRLDLDSPSTILLLKEKLEWIFSLRAHRQKQRTQLTAEGKPYAPRDEIFLIDELPSTLKLAKDWDDIQAENAERGERPPSIYKWLIRKLETLIFTAAEDRIFIWLICQTHKVGQIGLDTGTRDNMGVWSQGRGGNFVSIEAAIADAWLIPGKASRDEMVSRLEVLKKQSELPVFYTNIGGHQMGTLVGLHEIKRKQIWANQSPPQNVVPIRSSAPEEADEDIDDWGEPYQAV